MSQPPHVTVITPTFNRAAYLAETVESVLTQKVESLEYLILDDGSSDDTVRVVERYLPRIGLRYSPGVTITFLRHDNIGETRTVNKGLRLVTGEFFTIVNSDDPLMPDSLAKVIDALRRNPDALAAYPDWHVIDEHSKIVSTVNVFEYDSRSLLTLGHVSIGPGACFRRAALDLVGYRNPLLRYSADLDYWYRLALVGRIVHVPEVLATHRVHPASASVSERGARLANETAYLYSAYSRHPLLKPESARLTQTADAHGLFAAMFTCTSLRQASRLLAKSVLAQPMAALLRCQANGAPALTELFDRLGATRNGFAERIMPRLLEVKTRSEGTNLLVRGLLVDPLGMLMLADIIGVADLLAKVRSIPLYPSARRAGEIEAGERPPPRSER